MGCIDCDEDREHCHGVLVRHADGRTECIEGPACDAAVPAHEWAVSCAEVGCDCGGGQDPDGWTFLPLCAGEVSKGRLAA
jgi:hypothetical protein